MHTHTHTHARTHAHTHARTHTRTHTHTHTHRRQKLQESLCYRQFSVGVDEEEAWLNEKTTLVSSEEVGDTLAAVQVGVVTWVMARGWVVWVLSTMVIS